MTHRAPPSTHPLTRQHGNSVIGVLGTVAFIAIMFPVMKSELGLAPPPQSGEIVGAGFGVPATINYEVGQYLDRYDRSFYFFEGDVAVQPSDPVAAPDDWMSIRQFADAAERYGVPSSAYYLCNELNCYRIRDIEGDLEYRISVF